MVISVTYNNRDSILFALVYRRPKGMLFNNFNGEFCKYYPNFKNVIITGDFNCDLVSNSYESNYLREMIDSPALKVVPPAPTHHMATSDTWLDLLIVDDLPKISEYSKSESPFIAGHDLLWFSRNLSSPCSQSCIFSCRNFHDLDDVTFNRH